MFDFTFNLVQLTGATSTSILPRERVTNSIINRDCIPMGDNWDKEWVTKAIGRCFLMHVPQQEKQIQIIPFGLLGIHHIFVICADLANQETIRDSLRGSQEPVSCSLAFLIRHSIVQQPRCNDTNSQVKIYLVNLTISLLI